MLISKRIGIHTSGEGKRPLLSQKVEDRIKTVVEERVTKELAQMALSLKDAVQGPGSSEISKAIPSGDE